jgi:hypothetical protein
LKRTKLEDERQEEMRKASEKAAKEVPTLWKSELEKLMTSNASLPTHT